MSGDRPSMLERSLQRFRLSGAGLQKLMVWHRRLGIATAIIVLLLSITGVFLNHGNRLGFDRTYVSWGWLLSWYGVEPARAPISFEANGHWISGTGTRLYFDTEPLATVSTEIIGSSAIADGLIAAAFRNSLFLLSPDGEVIERLTPESLPGQLRRIGVLDDERLAVATDQGMYLADQDLIEWQPTTREPSWSLPAKAPAKIREQLMLAERGAGLTVERVMLDLHSGRLFGAWGPWVFDLAAIIFIVMAITGIIYWWQRRNLVAGYMKPNGKPGNPR